MKRDNSQPALEELKEKLAASGLSRREALLMAAGAAICPLIWAFTAQDAQAQKRCDPLSCSPKCVTCWTGCANGPDPKK